MSLTPRLTTIGLYNYDPSIFENLNMPDAVDKAILINHFLLTYGECPVLYTDAAFYKIAVKIWADSHYDAIEKIAAALAADYNPIHNYDRYESYTDTHTGQSKDSGTDTRTDETTSNSSGSVENTVSAYNESTYQPDSKQTSTGSAESDGTSATAYGKQTDTTGTDEHTAHLYGNIGVTTSQEMIDAEIKLRIESNLYEIVAGMMKADLCLLIY